MERKLYSMSELERLSGIKRRIIHFYVKERVIPPPIGTKGTAKYTERQLLSLQLIKQLKKYHLKLSGIKETLEALSVEEMRSVLNKAIKNTPEAWDEESLGKWVGLQIHEERSPYGTDSGQSQDKIQATEQFKLEAESPEKPQDKSPQFLRELKRNPAVNETSWERFEIVKGLELNVRKDLMEKLGSRLIQWIEHLRKVI